MRITRNTLASVGLLLLTTLSFPALALEKAAPESVGLSSERLQRLDDTMNAYIEEGRLPGTVVLIARHGKIAYEQAFGWQDREAGKAMDEQAMFRIASQTKAITSTAILILQEQGKLLIGDAVSRYLPEFAHTTVAEPDGNGGYRVVEARREITLRDLLTHTAGIDYGFGPAADRWKAAGVQGWYFADRDEPVRDTVARIAKLPQAAHPGEKFVYGYNTDILGAVVEVVSGQPLDVFFREHIFQPLGMADSHFYLPRGGAERLSTVYAWREDGLERTAAPGRHEGSSHVGQGHYVDGPRRSFSGGAGLVSTAGDYARFLQMLLNGGELDGRRILGRKSVQLMTAVHWNDESHAAEGAGFGLGFRVTKDVGLSGQPGSVGAFGWGGAYHSVYWVDPAEDLLVVYMTQLIPSGGVDDHRKLRALVYQALVDGK